MKIALFGASGKTGLKIIKQAIKKGIFVNAFVRRARDIEFDPALVKEINGSLENTELIASAVKGVDAVIITLGPRPPFMDVFCGVVTSTIISGMKKAGVKRLIVLTGAMIGANYKNRSRLFDMIRKSVVKKLPHMMDDRAYQEQVVMESGLDWTIVKPPKLTDGRHRGKFRTGESMKIGLISKIGRDDLAEYLLQLVNDRDSAGKAIFISY